MNVRTGRRTSAGFLYWRSLCPHGRASGDRACGSDTEAAMPWEKAAENVAGGGKTAEISRDRSHQLLKYAKSMCYDMQKYPVR